MDRNFNAERTAILLDAFDRIPGLFEEEMYLEDRGELVVRLAKSMVPMMYGEKYDGHMVLGMSA